MASGRVTRDEVVAFYDGTGTDHAGRRIETIWAFDDRQLEAVHDYVQWLFPLPEASRFNPFAPVLTPETAAAFRTRPDFRGRVLRSLDRMLSFYGFVRDGSVIHGGPMPGDPSPHWLSAGNHNHLRLSRIVRFLHHAGLSPEARSLRDRLVALAAERPGRVTADTRRHWQALPPACDQIG